MAVHPGLCQTWSETQIVGFLMPKLFFFSIFFFFLFVSFHSRCAYIHGKLPMSLLCFQNELCRQSFGTYNDFCMKIRHSNTERYITRLISQDSVVETTWVLIETSTTMLFSECESIFHFRDCKATNQTNKKPRG